MDEKEVKKRLAKLTRQECIVLYWRCHGFKCEQIAETLVISVKTVEFHLDNIYKKLQVKHLKDRERYLELKVAFCPLHVEGINNPETDFQKRPKPPPEPDIPPEDVKPIPKEALKIIRREDEEGLIPNVGGPVAKRPSRDIIIIPPPPTGDDDDDDEEEEKPRRANLWYALGGVVIGLLLATGALRFLAPTEVQATPTPQPTSTPVVQVVVVTATPQPTPEVTATLIPTAVPPVAVPPTPTKVPTAQPTNTPAPTPVPAPTVVPNTPPGSVLPLGVKNGGWRQDGIYISTGPANFEEDRQVSRGCLGHAKVSLTFDIGIWNDTPNDLIYRFSSDTWYVITDRGKKYQVTGANEGCDGGWPLERDKLVANEGWGRKVGVIAPLADFSNINWIRFVIPELARVKNATWHLDIPH